MKSRVSTSTASASVIAAFCLAFGACAPAGGGDARAEEAATPGAPSSSMTPPGSGGQGEQVTGAATSAVAAPQSGSAWVIFGADTIVAEVARTEEERAQGLMFREELPDGTGMIFVFDNVRTRSFWMQNTYLPLDIAYMDESWTIVDVQQMEPLTTAPHSSARPAMFALEVRQGWFAEKGIGVGAKAQIIFGG